MKKIFEYSIVLISLLILGACSEANESSSSEDIREEFDHQEESSESDFPNKPITLIVPFAAGGGTDIGARILASYLEEDLGVPITVLNKPGGGGWVGWTDLANARPDGYTIGYLNIPNLITGYMNPELERDENLDSFTPIANHVTDPGAIAVRADDDRFSTLDELIEYAKNNELTTTSTGVGSDDHIAAIKLNKEHGTKFKAVHANGFAENKTNVLGGHVDVLFANVGEVVPDYKKGDIKVLAVMSKERSPYLPDVPTLEEQGYGPIYSWSARGIGAPAGLEPKILEILENSFDRAINHPEQVEQMDALWLEIDYRNSEEYRKLLETEEEEVKKLTDLLGW